MRDVVTGAAKEARKLPRTCRDRGERPPRRCDSGISPVGLKDLAVPSQNAFCVSYHVTVIQPPEGKAQH